MQFGERYLRFPDLFPARAAGESWGDQRLVLDSPGGPYAISGLCKAQVEALEQRYGGLIRNDSVLVPEFKIAVFRMSREEFLPPGREVHFDRDPGGLSVRLAGPTFAALLESITAAIWTCEAQGPDFGSAFENVLRTLTSYRLITRGGLLLHSAAILKAGRAHVFFGPSGSGKSTLARRALDSGLRVLSDDLNALLPIDGRYRVAAVPFAGDLGVRAENRENFALASLNRLKQGGNRSRALSPANAVALLGAATPFLNDDPHRGDRVLEVLEQLASRTPTYEVETTKQGPLPEALLDKRPG